MSWFDQMLLVTILNERKGKQNPESAGAPFIPHLKRVHWHY